MKTLTYGLIFLLSSVLTVACGGGGSAGGAPNASTSTMGSFQVNSLITLSAAFITVSY